MAHMVETMAYAGEVPWHGLGEKVSNDLTPVQMMDKAGLNWKVRELESFVEFDGNRMPTGQKSLVRESDGRILTNVGADWNPCQNETAFEFFTEFVMNGDMEMHTAWQKSKNHSRFLETIKSIHICSSLIHTNMVNQSTYVLHQSASYVTTHLHFHLDLNLITQ